MVNHENGALRRRNNLHKDIQARMVMETRQRDRRAPPDDDEDTPVAETISLTPPPRLTRARLTSTEEETSTPARVRQPLTTETSIPVDDALTTSTTSTRARPTTSSTTEEETTTSTTPSTTSTTPTTTSTTPTTTSTTPSTTSTTPRTTPSPTTSSRTTTPVSSSTTSSALSSSASPIGAADANASSSDKSGGSSNAGTIAGVIIALVAVAAIAAFFGLRWRKKRQRAAEDAAIFPGAGGAAAGGVGAYGNKRSSKGYNQHMDQSYEDLAGAGAGANGGYGEKWGEDDSTPNMAGFGSRMSDNTYANHEKAAPGAGMAGYGTLSMASGMNRLAGNNDAVRGSFSQQSLLGRDANGGFSPLSPGQYVSSPQFQPGYPPVGPGFPPASPANRGLGGGPQAAMMNHAPAQHMSDSLPQHQINDLNNNAIPSERRISHEDSNNIALKAAAAAAAGGLAASAIKNNSNNAAGNAGAAPGPFEDPASEGQVYVVVRTFEPSMPDELVIFPGDKVQIVMEYDDGWCLGCNLTSAVRDGAEPARGVFPRDCVDLFVPSSNTNNPLTPPGAASRTFGTIAEENEDEDQPLNTNGGAGLSRAPTLPPFETSRFSMGDSTQQRNSMVGAGNANRQSLAVPNQAQAPNRQSVLGSPQPHQVPLPASRGVSMLSSAPLSPSRVSEDVDAEDAYGGLGSSGPTPTSPAFPPNIQVSPSPAVPQPKHASAMTTATTEEHTGDLLDEFPSTPRTEHGGGAGSQQPTPVNGGFERLSMPKSASNRSLKRTSSLIASKDADLFLALGDSLGRDEKHV